jgi:hypothetical protein
MHPDGRHEPFGEEYKDNKKRHSRKEKYPYNQPHNTGC